MVANMEYIKNEQIEFLGKEIPIIEKASDTLEDSSKVEVIWLYPTANTYEDWVNASLHACWNTWEVAPYKEADACIKKGNAETMLMKLLDKRNIGIVYEIPKFTFKINGLSRAMTHQCVRSRFANYGQQSLRVAVVAHQPVRKPSAEEFENDDVVKREYKRIVQESHRLYLDMIKTGIPVEQARNILPIGQTTSIVITMDLRTLVDYFRNRTSSIVQDEHKELVVKIAKAFEESQPNFFQFVCTKVDGLKELVAREPKELIE